MFNLKQLSTLTIALGISFSALADNWISMKVVADDSFKSKNSGSAWMTCTYDTGIFTDRQTITIRTSESSCPYYIEFNPELGKWRKN